MRGRLLVGLALICVPVFGLGLALGWWTLTSALSWLGTAAFALGAVTANQVVKRQEATRSNGPVYQSTTLYEGTLAFWNSAGYLDDDTATGANKFAGVVINEVDNSAGDSGDLDAELWIEGIFELTGSGFAITDIGKEVFASDNYTITLTDSTAAVPIGTVAEYVSSTILRVRIYGAPHQVSLEGDVIAFTGSTGANEIRVPDNLADGLSIEGTHGDFMVFTTTNGAEAITVSEAITFTDHVTFSGAIDVTFSGTTGQSEVVLTTNLADALSVKDSAGDLIVFDLTTGTQVITITPAVTLNGDLTIQAGKDLNFIGTNGQSQIVITTNLADALSIKDSAADIIVICTTTGSPTVTITPATTVTGALTMSAGGRGAGTTYVPFIPIGANASAVAPTAAIPLTNYLSWLDSSGGATTQTLAAGNAIGQLKRLQAVHANDDVVTVTSLSGGTTITFTNVGEYVVLCWSGTAWIIIESGNVLLGTNVGPAVA